MNLVCENCGAEYRIDASKVPKKGGFITCKSCSHKIRVKPPEEDAIPLAGSEPPAAPEPTAPMQHEPVATAPVAPEPAASEPAAVNLADAGIPLAGSAESATDQNLFALGGSDPLPPLPSEAPLETPLAGDLPDDLPAPGAGAVLTPDAPGAPIEPAPVETPLHVPAPTDDASIDDIPMLADDDAIPLADDDDLLALDEEDLPVPALNPGELPPHGGLDLPAPAGPDDLPAAADPNPDSLAPFTPDDTIQEPIASQALEDLPAPALPSEEDATLPGIAFPDGKPFTEPAGFEVATTIDSYTASPGAADLPALAEDALPPLATDDLPALPEAEAPAGLDLPMPSAPTDLPAPEIDFAAPNLDAVDDLPAPSQIDFDGTGGAGGLSDDLFAGVGTDIPLDNGLPDPNAAPDLGPSGLELEAPVAPTTAPTDDFAAPAVSDEATQDAALPPTDSGDTHLAAEDELPDPPPKKRGPSVVFLGALAAVVLAVVGVAVFAPELIGLGGDTTKLPEIPADIPDDPDEEDTKKPETDSDGEPDAPELPPAPKLTSSNVHALPFGQLKPSVANYAGAEDAAPGLTLFGYFRLAYTFGDEEAAVKLRELAPKKINAAKVDDELLVAGALGSMIVNGKAGPAKKLGERALKSSKRNSALVEYVTGLAYNGKPAAKALKHLNRAVELDPGLVDASVARAELLFKKRGSETEAEEALSAAVAEVPGPAIALRAARILIENDRFSAIDRVGKPLISSAQAEQLARSDHASFFTLLIAKNVWVANFAAAAAAAEKWTEVEPSPASFIAHSRLTAASGGDAEPVLRSGLENVKGDGDRARIFHELGRLALNGEDVESARKILGELKALPGKEAQGWIKLLEGDIHAARGQLPKAKAAYAASGRGRSKFIEPRLATLLAEGNGKGPNLAKLTQLEKRTDSPEVVFALAGALDAKGNPGGAATLYQKGLWTSAAPAEPLANVVAWARAAAAAGDTERAYAQLKAVQEARPEDANVVGELVSLAQKMGRAEEAVGWYEKLIKAVPDNLDYQISYAGALNDAGKFNEAATLIDKLHRDKPDAKSGRSLAELGRAVMDKDEVRARTLLTEAKRLEPSAEIYALLAKVEAKQQRYDAAIVALQEAVKLSGGDAEMRLELGLMQRERGNPQDAVDNLKLVLRAEPGNTRAVLALGDALSSVGKHREALQNYQKAMKAGSEDVELQMKAALIQLQQLNQLPQAVKGFRKVLEVAPNTAEAHYYLGYAYKDMDRAADARSSLQKFLELDPENELAAEVEQELKNL